MSRNGEVSTALVNMDSGQGVKLTSARGVVDLIRPGDDAALLRGIVLRPARAGGPVEWSAVQGDRLFMRSAGSTIAAGDPIGISQVTPGDFVFDSAAPVAYAAESGPGTDPGLFEGYFVGAVGAGGGGAAPATTLGAAYAAGGGNGGLNNRLGSSSLGMNAPVRGIVPEAGATAFAVATPGTVEDPTPLDVVTLGSGADGAGLVVVRDTDGNAVLSTALGKVTANGTLGCDPLTLSAGGSVATDATLSNAFAVPLTGNGTLENPSGLLAGRTYVWRIKQDAAGGRTLAYGALFKWPGGVPPVLSTAPNAVDIITAYYDGTILCAVAQKAFA